MPEEVTRPEGAGDNPVAPRGEETVPGDDPGKQGEERFAKSDVREAELDAQIDRVLKMMMIRYKAAAFAFDEALARWQTRLKTGSKTDDPIVRGLIRQRTRELGKLKDFEEHPSEKNYHEALSGLAALESLTTVDDGFMKIDREWFVERELADALREFARNDEEVRATVSKEDRQRLANDLGTRLEAYRNVSTYDERVVALAAVREARAQYQDAVGIEDIGNPLELSEETLEDLYQGASLERVENELIERVLEERKKGSVAENAWVRKATSCIVRSRRGTLSDEERVTLLREMHALNNAAARAEATEREAARERAAIEALLHRSYREGVLPALLDDLRRAWKEIGDHSSYQKGEDREREFEKYLDGLFAEAGFADEELVRMKKFFRETVGI